MKRSLNRNRKLVVNNARPTRWESLETRQMLSAATAAGYVATPNLTISPLASTSVFQGYSPSQIRHAYGLDQVSGNGAGQTIAIVDAYNDPNIAADLHTFDQKYGLSDPSLKVVNQGGGSALPKTDAGWAGEIALDVEWAHAIAPGANIVLVEATSSSLTDLMTAVNTARNQPGVSTVSMSWGGSEFRGQTQFDSYFTTPSGHQGVTFVAASGDSGSWYGPEWPATSPNVLSVGGTSLNLNASGNYGSETGWSGSGGGISSVYKVPSYQSAAQSTGARTSPDVAWDANPNTGFAVYDSVPDQGYSGWQVVGGTSAGAPQWAALISIADQSRQNSGKGTLDGASGTLPALYSLYAAPGSANYASYTAAFNDIASGATSSFMRAHTGYDGVTGLGTPNASKVIGTLAGAGGTTSTSTSSATAAATTVTKATRHSTTTASSSGSTSSTTAAQPTSSTATSIPSPAPAMPSAVRGDVVAAIAIPALRINTTVSMPQTYIARLRTGVVETAARIANPTVSALMSNPLGEGQWRGIITPLAGPVGQLIQRAADPAASLADFDSPQLLGALSDEMMAFVRESAGQALTNTAVSLSHHARAWAATIATLGVDAVLLATWIGSKRKDQEERETSPTFSVRRLAMT